MYHSIRTEFKKNQTKLDSIITKIQMWFINIISKIWINRIESNIASKRPKNWYIKLWKREATKKINKFFFKSTKTVFRIYMIYRFSMLHFIIIETKRSYKLIIFRVLILKRVKVEIFFFIKEVFSNILCVIWDM